MVFEGSGSAGTETCFSGLPATSAFTPAHGPLRLIGPYTVSKIVQFNQGREVDARMPADYARLLQGLRNKS